ncbi:RNA polymerase I-specific transcription initiation factor RRN6-like protein [Cryomyces antarcticus]
MADHSLSDLNYGHLGEAIYNRDAQEWLFNRQLGRKSVLMPLGEPDLSGSSATVHYQSRSTDDSAERPSEIVRQQTKDLERAIPGLWATYDSLPVQLKLSKAISSATTDYDPTRGDLLAFGNIYDEGQKRRIQVAAFPGGLNGEVLRVVQVREERRGWKRDKSIWIKAPEFSGDTGWWSGDGVPIQQVCFAQLVEAGGTFLAARSLSHTAIYRPVYRIAPTAQQQYRSSSLRNPSSLLDVNLLLSLPVKITGNDSHADVTFNPWIQRQLALVDRRGAWSVWDIHSSLGTHRPVLFREGIMSEGPPSRHGHSGPLDDGWARIVWIGNSHTLMVCTRRQITIFDIHSNPVRLKCPELGIARTAHWFLDVRSSPIHKDHVFILTSSNLFWLQVTTLDGKKSNNQSNAIAKVLLSWKHFRSDEDASLRLSITADEDDMLILISSRLNALVTSFRLSMPPYPHAIPLSLSDPVEVMLSPSVVPSSTSEVGVTFAINSLSLQPLQYYEYNGNLLVYADGPGHSYKQHGVRFYSMTILSESLGVTHRLYYALPVSGRQVEHDPRLTHNELGTKVPRILAPTWQDKSVRSTYRVHEDDFIVEDGFEDKEEDDIQVVRFQQSSNHRSRNFSRRKTQSLNKDVDPATYDNQLVYRETQDSTGRPVVTVSDILQRVRSKADNIEELAEQRMQTLFELCDGLPSVGDVDEASTSLQRLVEEVALKSKVDSLAMTIQPVASASVLGLPDSGRPTILLTSVYHHMIDLWLASLPEKVSGRIRFTHEQMARRIAAEVYLASTTMKLYDPDVGPDLIPSSLRTGNEESTSFSLPVRFSTKGKGPGSWASPQALSSQPSSSQFPSSSSHPESSSRTALPTPSATPSLISSSSLSTNPLTLADNAFRRLRQYTTFSKATPPPPLPKPLSTVLSHWTLGADPAEYDWDATRQALESESHTANEMSEAERARIARKAAKLLKRQRRETAAAEAATAASQQGPLVMASQPVGPSGRWSSPAPRDAESQLVGSGVQSSQQTQSQRFPASQVEPGRHGGRQRHTARGAPAKKKRAEGFR